MPEPSSVDVKRLKMSLLSLGSFLAGIVAVALWLSDVQHNSADAMSATGEIKRDVKQMKEDHEARLRAVERAAAQMESMRADVTDLKTDMKVLIQRVK